MHTDRCPLDISPCRGSECRYFTYGGDFSGDTCLHAADYPWPIPFKPYPSIIEAKKPRGGHYDRKPSRV